MICLSVKHNVICRFFWAPRHHKASHGVSVEARNYNEKNVDLSGPFVTYSYDLISMSWNCLLDTTIFSFCVIVIGNWDYSTTILKWDISWHHYHMSGISWLWLLYTAFTEDIFKYTATLEIANTQFINTIKMWIDVVQGKCRVNKKIGSTRNFSVDISFI